jgi:hypothetical protein
VQVKVASESRKRSAAFLNSRFDMRCTASYT